ncbi:MAG: orotidine-5'-phosphate decarboxylase [Gammaproteobacteria bacterium]|nr:orotidine-5'-phosphate decarboxylase [Gammaproteobacteria bacterium]
MNQPRVIVALDFAIADEALAFVDRLVPGQCQLKVGLELFTAAGPNLVREVVARGFDVFLDLKLHDIPNTVEQACRQLSHLGTRLLTVHCLGGSAMMAAARRGVGEAADRPRVIGVTLLTSLSTADVREIGLGESLADRALKLAELAHVAGLDGVVCAPTEARALRQRFGAGFLLVTPGIRPTGSAIGDQQRVLTPAQAIAEGADLLVIGRPITRAPDPLATLAAIEHEIAGP